MNKIILLIFCLFNFYSINAQNKAPNIIYILADDMGYGDLGCNNPDSKIPTPHLDSLAEQGMRFTDAHAASSICTPSRYNVLTGRYSWRTRLKRGIVWEWDSPLIEPNRLTVASLLKQHGYATHCIGKWHLGWDWMTVDGELAGPQLPFGQQNRECQCRRQACRKQTGRQTCTQTYRLCVREPKARAPGATKHLPLLDFEQLAQASQREQHAPRSVIVYTQGDRNPHTGRHVEGAHRSISSTRCHVVFSVSSACGFERPQPRWSKRMIR